MKRSKLSSVLGQKMEKKMVLLPAIFVLAACSTMPVQMLAVTNPSGRPEAIFMTPEAAHAAGQISSGCMSSGMSVVSSSSFQVVCEYAISMDRQIVTQTLIGNAYSTRPREFVQFNLADLGETVRVQAISWVETQMAFGQLKKVATDQGTIQKNDLQRALFAMGGMPVPGSVSVSKPRIGLHLIELSIDGHPGGEGGVFVASLNPGSPADQAGLNICDRIESIDGISVQNIDDYALQANAIPFGSMMNLIVLRDGIELPIAAKPTISSLTVEAEMFTAIEEVELSGC